MTMVTWNIRTFNVLRLGFATAALRPIPTGLRPPAQGWRARAYLGFTFRDENNLNEVVADCARTKTALKSCLTRRVSVGIEAERDSVSRSGVASTDGVG